MAATPSSRPGHLYGNTGIRVLLEFLRQEHQKAANFRRRSSQKFFDDERNLSILHMESRFPRTFIEANNDIICGKTQQRNILKMDHIVLANLNADMQEILLILRMTLHAQLKVRTFPKHHGRR